MRTEVSRIKKHGTSNCVTIPKAVSDQLGWKNGDVLVLRVVGEKLALFLERIPFEEIGILDECRFVWSSSAPNASGRGRCKLKPEHEWPHVSSRPRVSTGWRCSAFARRMRPYADCLDLGCCGWCLDRGRARAR